MNGIMLLENQLPWVVLKTLLRFTNLDVTDFVGKMARTLETSGEKELTKLVLLAHDHDEPPHLLSLLRYYKMDSNPNGMLHIHVSRKMAKTTSAIELAEIGIKLTTGETTKFTDLGNTGTPFSRKIFLAPLLLDEVRECWLANMAAYEVSMGMATTTSVRKDTENPVVSSSLAVLGAAAREEPPARRGRGTAE
ncbi:hypothetical protein D1007_51091 [Hordeum vulgare]|nr:hypothetical protein D1007_51091 [Hordeum vulgare]